MEKQNEKQIIYESLVELTKQSDSEIHFSKMKIREHIKEKIEKEQDININYRAGYKPIFEQDSSGKWHHVKNERIDLNDILPRIKSLPLALEELVSEGKAKKIAVIDQSWHNRDYYKISNFTGCYYRAILGEENGK